MAQAAHGIRKQLHKIGHSGFLLPESTLLRKAIVSVKTGKLRFSNEQLKQVVFKLMGKLLLSFVLARIRNQKLQSWPTKDILVYKYRGIRL